MNKNSSSIRGIISFSFVLLMVGTITIIAYIIFSSWTSSTERVIKEIENDATKDIVNEIENLIAVPNSINKLNQHYFANKFIDLSNENNRVSFFVNTIKSNNGEIYSFSYGLENGNYYGARRNINNEIEYYQSTSETNGHSFYYTTTEKLTKGKFIKDFGEFDPRTRVWYSMAKKAGKPVFSPLYKHFVKDDLVLTAANPIYDQKGDFLGVLGTHITLSRLNDFLKGLVFKQEAAAYVVEKGSGELVANSLGYQNFEKLSDGMYQRAALDKIEDKSIIEAYENYIKTKKDNVVRKTKDGKLHIKLTEYKLDGIDWLIITEIPDTPFSSEINNNIKTAVYLSIIAIFLSILIYKKSTDFILKPINNLIDATDKFSKGDLSQRARIYKNDEIGKISYAFNNMAEELNIHINHLEEKVRERTAEIEKTNRQLELAKMEADKANQAKSDFLANMSHEIRTPLNAIIGFSEILQETVADDKQQHYIKTINSAGNSLLTIINDILDLSKIEAGKIELQYKPVRLSRILKDIEMMFSQTVQGKGIEFRIEMEDIVPDLIIFDEVRIRQILLNLVGNAVKFTEKGYVKIFIDAAPSITNDISSVDLHIAVEDTGIGIPVTEKQKIFEAFTQISGQSIKKYGGTGLGLSITKKLVDALKGKISVESIVGKGSTFHIIFDDVQIAATQSLPDEPETYFARKYRFGNEKILVVDDIETNRFLLKELLLKAGLQVLLAENGHDALNMCEQEKPNLIITDLVMPVMDGFEASKRLKQKSETKDIPIIALSASTSKSLPKDHLFEDYFLKPVQADQILGKIAQLLHVETKEDLNITLFHKDKISQSLGPEEMVEIREQLNPLLTNLETSIIISTVKELAEQLILLGEQFQDEYILGQGNELMSYAECYDIVKIKLKLKQLEKFLFEDIPDDK